MISLSNNFTTGLVSEALSFGFKPVLIYTDLSKGVGKAPLEKDWIGKYSTISQDDLYKATKHRGNDNIGVLCGQASNIIVIDVDIQDNGVENWEKICSEYGVIDMLSFDTPTVLTGSLGYHYYFRYSEEYSKLPKKLAPGIDILGNGKQVVYPGSFYPGCIPLNENKVHKCGSKDFDGCLFHQNQYEWLKSPRDTEIKEVPEWLKMLILQKQKNDKKNSSEDIVPQDDFSLLKECLKILKKKADPYSEWIEVIWCIRGLGFPKEYAHLFSKFSSKYEPKSVDEIWDRYNENKVNWNWGSIRNWLKETLSEEDYFLFCQTHFKDIEEEFRLYEGDYGLANIFSERFKDRLVIINEEGTGLLFDEKKKIWIEYHSTYLSNLVSKDLLPIVNKYLKVQEEKLSLAKDKIFDDIIKSKIKELSSVKKYILSTKGCKQIFVKVMFNLLDKSFYSRLDSDSFHLPIKGGKVVHLKNGITRDRDNTDLFTFECPVEYQPEKCEGRDIVFNYLKSICNEDESYTRWMIKFLGYLLTRETSDRSLYILWGKGRNGKSKLLNLLEFILGKFYTSCSSDVLIKTDRKGGATPELIPLMYSRVAVLSETNEEDKLNSERIKKLTGDDLISARKLFQEEITFKPKAKLLLITNKKPVFDVNDKAMIDRIKLLPFLANFENNFKNNEYVESIKRDYLTHFFSLIVDGCIEWWKDKDLSLPDIAVKATAEYQKENDSISRWMEECCEVWNEDKGEQKEDYKEQPSVLFESYNGWCIQSNTKSESRNKFGEIMVKIFGDKVQKSLNKKQVWFYTGIKLN